MNGSAIRLVIDTNVIFMALYNKNSKAGKIIKYAINGKIELFSPDTVKEEISRVLKRELNYLEEEINLTIKSLPIIWMEKSIYQDYLSRTKVKHLPDKPVEAVSIVLNCGVLSADKHFKDRIDINSLLKKIKK